MARLEDIAFAPAKWTTVATGTNSTVTATRASPGASAANYIVGISLSASAAPVAAVTAQVRANASTELDRFELPAGAFAPIVINYVRPLRVPAGQSCDVTLPALGAGVVGTAVIRGFTA